MNEIEVVVRHALLLGLRVQEISTRSMEEKMGKGIVAYFDLEKTIYIVDDLWEDPDGPYVVAHEIGHSIDVAENPRHREMYRMFSRMMRGDEIEVPDPLRSNLLGFLREFHLMIEENAFEQGEELLWFLNIPIRPEWRKTRKDYLDDCESIYADVENPR